MRKFRFGLCIVAIILIIVALTYIDFGDLSWKTNRGEYFGIISMIILIILMIYSNRKERIIGEKKAKHRTTDKIS